MCGSGGGDVVPQAVFVPAGVTGGITIESESSAGAGFAFIFAEVSAPEGAAAFS